MVWFLQRPRFEVVMLGLNNSGKTTILYKILKGKTVITIPTFGFNMEIVQFNDIELDLMDVGGSEKMVPLWKHYLITASAIIYVLDCTDTKRWERNKTLLADVLTRPERKGLPLLVVVNKTDNSKFPIETEELMLQLNLPILCIARQYNVCKISAATGQGLNEAFTWLCASLGSGYASKRLKRLYNKPSKLNIQDTTIKQRRRENGLYSPSFIKSNWSDETSEEITPSSSRRESRSDAELTEQPINQISQSQDEVSIDNRTYSFADSFNRINAFFKAKASEVNVMWSGNSSPASSRRYPEANETQEEGFVDTFSSEPHTPMSPRRKNSLHRHRSMLQTRSSILSRKYQRGQSSGNVSDASIEKDTTEGDISNNETNFERLVNFFSRNSLINQNENPQNHLYNRLWGINDKSPEKIPHSSKVINRSTVRHDPTKNAFSVKTRQIQRNTDAKTVSKEISPSKPAPSVDKTDSQLNGSTRSKFLNFLASIRLNLSSRKETSPEPSKSDITVKENETSNKCRSKILSPTSTNSTWFVSPSPPPRLPLIQIQVPNNEPPTK